MNAEKLKELKDRAEKASKLAREIEEIQAADHRGNYLSLSAQRTHTYQLLHEDLLQEIFDLGKAELLKRKEAELTELLFDKPAVFVPTPFTVPVRLPGPSDFLPPLQTSDQPAEPIATIWCSDKSGEVSAVGSSG